MVEANVPPSIDGFEEANQLLRDLAAGLADLHDAWLWVAELRREGLGQLADEIAHRLPRTH